MVLEFSRYLDFNFKRLVSDESFKELTGITRESLKNFEVAFQTQLAVQTEVYRQAGIRRFSFDGVWDVLGTFDLNIRTSVLQLVGEWGVAEPLLTI